MKTILVPTDFSDHSLFALKVAVQIARKTEAVIKLAHVYNFPGKSFEKNKYFDEYYHAYQLSAEARMKELISLDFMQDVAFEKYIVSNMLMWQLSDDERFKNVDLIVMGSHGESGFNKIIIGSNTERMVRMANPPVLTIKNEINGFDVKKMVFASNFLKESYTVFEKIKSFAAIYKAHLYLLKVITPKEFESTPSSLELLERFIDQFELTNCSVNIYNHKSVESGIIEFGESVEADLIAIETHGRTGLSHLINGSLAEDIVKHEATPVLSVKIPKLSVSVMGSMDLSHDYESWGSEFL